MFASFDEKSKVLRIGKIKIPNDFTPYEDSNMFTAYKKYFLRLDDGSNVYSLKNDFTSIVAQIRSELNKFSESLGSIDVKFEIDSICYGDKDYRIGRSDYMVTTVFVNLIINGKRIDKLKSIPLMRYPYMNRFGVIEKDGMEYAVQAAMEPHKYITFDAKLGAKTLDIMLHAYKLSFTQHGDDIHVILNGNKRSKVCLTALAGYVYLLHKEINSSEGDIGAKRMFQDIRSLTYKPTAYNEFIPDIKREFTGIDVESLINITSDSHTLDIIEEYGSVNTSAINQMLNSTIYLEMFGFGVDSTHILNPFGLDDLRDELNDMLSIDRAVGRTLADDIISNSKVIGHSGEIVTEDLILRCHSKHINRLRVLRKESYHLQQTAVAIEVRKIPAGFIVDDLLREGLLKGAYFNEAVTSDAVILEPRVCVIDNYAVCTPSLINIILNCECCFMKCNSAWDNVQNIPEKLLREKKYIYLNDDDKPQRHNYIYCWKNIYNEKENDNANMKSMKVVLFTETIIGNNHFKDEDGNWYYWCSDKQGNCSRLDSSKLLTFYDLISLMSFLPELYSGKYLISDKDLGIRKKVATIDAQFNRIIRDKVSKQFVSNVSRAIKAYHSKSFDIQKIMEGQTMEDEMVKKLTDACNIFYRTLWENMGGEGYNYIKLVDKSNPIAYVSSINQVSNLFAGTNEVPTKARFMAMGSYSRTCGFETPASQKLGLTNNICCRAKIVDGKILVPYYKVINVNGKVKIPFEQEPEYLDVIQEENYIIADIMSLDFDENGECDENKFVLARVPSRNSIEKLTLECVPLYMVNYVNVYPDQSLGHSASTIPLIGRVDATRVTYGVSMTKQAVPLVNREIPRLVTDAYQTILWKTQKYQINAEEDGIVDSIATKSITGSGYYGLINITVKYDVPIREFSKDNPFGSATEADRNIEIYSCSMAEFSDKCVILRKIEVVEGQRIKKGDILVSSNYTKDNYIAIGINALVAEVSTGYNYEDGVQISARLRDKLTSYSRKGTIIRPPCEASPVDRSHMVYIEYNNEYIFRWHPKSRLIHLKGSDAYATSKMISGFPVSIHVPSKKSGVKNKKVWQREVESIEISPINRGDKTANRYGNKGVDSTITDNSQMLCLDNGEFFDVVYNPNGVASRMNLGQLIEMAIALASYIVDCHLQVMAYNEGELSDLYDYYYYIWRCIEDGVENANSYKPYWIPDNFVKYIGTQQKRMENWRGILDEECKAEVFDPQTGYYLKERAYIGINYVEKLVQMSDHKINARGGAFTDGQSYKAIDARPDKGAKVQGGQSVGYMEANAIAAHGCNNLLHEIQHERGDDLASRQIMMIESLVSELDDSPLADVLREKLPMLKSIRERRSLTKFRSILRGLGMDIEIIDDDEEENDIEMLPNDLHEYEDSYYLKDSFIKGQQPYYYNKEDKETINDNDMLESTNVVDDGIE